MTLGTGSGATDTQKCILGTDTRYEQVRRELDKRLLAWLQDVNDPILHGPVSTPYYMTTDNT